MKAAGSTFLRRMGRRCCACPHPASGASWRRAAPRRPGTILPGTGGNMTPELTVTGLSKTYPNGVRALVDVDLHIGRGMFGLLGPNGAGKSTLMRTIATLQEPD